MTVKNNIIISLILLTTIYHPCCHAIKVGNNSAVYSIHSTPVFPASDSDNSMFGFAQFAGGFTLEDATTSCTFSSSFPISGPINMNGGTLYYNKIC
jgi:hypothetical protein